MAKTRPTEKTCEEQLQLALSSGRTPEVWLARAHVIGCEHCVVEMERLLEVLLQVRESRTTPIDQTNCAQKFFLAISDKKTKEARFAREHVRGCERCQQTLNQRAEAERDRFESKGEDVSDEEFEQIRQDLLNPDSQSD